MHTWDLKELQWNEVATVCTRPESLLPFKGGVKVTQCSETPPFLPEKSNGVTWDGKIDGRKKSVPQNEPV